MDFAQDADPAGLVDVLVGVAQRLARAHLLQHVVEAGHGELRVRRQPLLAERIQALAEIADTRTLGVRRVGKGEGVENELVLITWIVSNSHPTACG